MDLTQYRTLGRSGLAVSPLALGTMTFGAGRRPCERRSPPRPRRSARSRRSASSSARSSPPTRGFPPCPRLRRSRRCQPRYGHQVLDQPAHHQPRSRKSGAPPVEQHRRGRPRGDIRPDDALDLPHLDGRAGQRCRGARPGRACRRAHLLTPPSTRGLHHRTTPLYTSCMESRVVMAASNCRPLPPNTGSRTLLPAVPPRSATPFPAVPVWRHGRPDGAAHAGTP